MRILENLSFQVSPTGACDVPDIGCCPQEPSPSPTMCTQVPGENLHHALLFGVLKAWFTYLSKLKIYFLLRDAHKNSIVDLKMYCYPS